MITEIISKSISWTHILSATASLFLGAWVLFIQKGGIRHRQLGKLYFLAMLINNLSALLIYNAFGRWFFPHTLALVTIAVLIPGFLITHKKQYKHWLKVHIICMVLSYYFLVGGAINETFLHVKALRPLITGEDPVVGISHFIAQLIFLGLITYFLIKFRRLGKYPESSKLAN